jgi:hypothetical protein
VGDLAQRAQQPLDVPDAVLEQVRQSGGAVAEQLEGVGLVGALGQDHNFGVGMVGLDGVSGVEAFHGPVGAGSLGGRLTGYGHADVGEHMFDDVGECLRQCVPGGRYDLRRVAHGVQRGAARNATVMPGPSTQQWAHDHIQGRRKVYPDRTIAVCDLTLEIRSGEITVLLGPLRLRQDDGCCG